MENEPAPKGLCTPYIRGLSERIEKDYNHTIDWKGATVEKRVSDYWQRRTEELIEIRRTIPNMKLDRGLVLPMVWTPILSPPPARSHR